MNTKTSSSPTPLDLINELFQINTKEKSKQHRVGLILYERLVNLPPDLTPYLYSGLLKEIDRANNINNKKDPCYTAPPHLRLDMYIILSKITILDEEEEKFDDEDVDAKLKKKKRKRGENNTKKKDVESSKKRKKLNKDENREIPTDSSSFSSTSLSSLSESFSLDTVIYLHPEDEVFIQNSVTYFFFPIMNDIYHSKNSNIIQKGLMILLNLDGLRKSVKDLHQFFNIK
jgi:hypothetical protein